MLRPSFQYEKQRMDWLRKTWPAASLCRPHGLQIPRFLLHTSLAIKLSPVPVH